MNKETQLSWVIVDDQLHSVSEFSHLKPHQRPLAYCPVCKRQVIMRLGDIRVFHAAHKPDDVCVLTQPETALHFNAKLHLAQELRKKKPISINLLCNGASGAGYHCKNSTPYIYLDGWDAVEVEYSIDQYRPDIVLLKSGKAIGAVEVFVTHAIEPEKEAHLQNLSLPWIEVNAHAVFLPTKNENYWVADQPILYRKLNYGTIDKWTCPECQKVIELIRIEKENLAEKRRIEQEKITEKRRKEQRKLELAKLYVITAIRMIDLYSFDGKRFREIYFARKRVQNGVTTEIRIDDHRDVVCCIKKPVLPTDISTLRKSFDEHIKNKADSECLVDKHMTWQVWNNTIPVPLLLDESAHSPFPKRYSWSPTQMQWYPVPEFESIDWNNNFTDIDNHQALIEKWHNSQKIEKIKRMNKFNKQDVHQLVPKADELSHTDGLVKTINANPLPDTFRERDAECIFCHRITSNWWSYDGKTGTCKCRDCQAEGKS